MSISIDPRLKAEVERICRGRYTTPSAYVVGLIVSDLERRSMRPRSQEG